MMDNTISTKPSKTYNYATFELIRHHSFPRDIGQKQFESLLESLRKYSKYAEVVMPFEDFMKAVTLRQCGFKPSSDLSPEEYEKAAEDALNDLKTRHRFIFSDWPRPDPMPTAQYNALEKKPYQYITAHNSLPGKMAPNGVEHWGETLHDFYYTRRYPDIATMATISCGSKLLRWCEANGEAEGTTWNGKEVPAKKCIEWAREEGDPQVVEVYDIASLIRETEERIRGAYLDELAVEVVHMKDKIRRFFSEEPELWTLQVPPPSVFHPSAYPPAWKDLHPFATKGPAAFSDIPSLEHYIPQHLLPKKLIVHDPYKLLRAVHQEKQTSASWTEKTAENSDHTHTYRLRFSNSLSTKERREQDKSEMETEQEKAKEVLAKFLENPHSSTNPKPRGIVYYPYGDASGKIPPPVYVVLPPRETPVAPDETHLYLSGSHFLGEGNHSFVYHAEWEVPRSMLVPDELCKQCLADDADAILAEEDGKNGERKDPCWNELSGSRVLSVPPPLPLITVGAKGNLAEETYEMPRRPHQPENPSLVYTGPYRVVQSRCQYQNLERGPYCAHLEEEYHPLTTKVRVAAKLSIENDDHLAAEARNYQKFPKHIFQHWSGFNVVKSVNDPVPIGPLVPQFYGYYVPDEAEEKKAQDEEDGEGGEVEKKYLSPILLMEHCGKAIVSRQLSIDDRHECIGLCLRLHHANWVHGSLYQRNILRKPGPLSAHPSVRQENMEKRGGYGVEWSFRFIDFGRTRGIRDGPGVDAGLKDESHKVQDWLLEWRDLWP